MVYMDAAHGWCDTPIYWRGDLPAGIGLVGPAIINEMSATTLVLPSQTVRVDAYGNLILRTAA